MSVMFLFFFLPQGLFTQRAYEKCFLHFLVSGKKYKNVAFMTFSSFSSQKIAICIHGLLLIPCMHYGTLAHSTERLSHYCANDMQLLKEHFQTTE